MLDLNLEILHIFYRFVPKFGNKAFLPENLVDILAQHYLTIEGQDVTKCPLHQPPYAKQKRKFTFQGNETVRKRIRTGESSMKT